MSFDLLLCEYVTAEKNGCDEILNMAEQGAAILVIVWQTNISVSAVLAYLHVKCHFDNRNKSYCDKTSYKTSEALWEAFKATVCTST